MKGNKRRTHRENVHNKTRSRVVKSGDGFKIETESAEEPFYKEPLPPGRPPVTDLALADRRGCLPAILRFFIRQKYGDI